MIFVENIKLCIVKFYNINFVNKHEQFCEFKTIFMFIYVLCICIFFKLYFYIILIQNINDI